MPTAAEHPGKILQERYLKPLGLTLPELAKSLGISVRRISELVRGRRSLTPDMAARLALFFEVPPDWWLKLQARYDATHRANLDALRGIVTPYEGLADVLVKPDGVERLAPAERHPETSSTVGISAELEANLRAQVKLATELTARQPREPVEKILDDGTVALVGR